jgi:hypothetical protein
MKNLGSSLTLKPKAVLASRHLLDFVIYTKSNYEVNWHHKLLCNYLDRFVVGEITRLMVFMPPQHGKSELVSRNLPAYILGRAPKSKIVIASYSDTLATSFNRDCQRIIDEDKYHDVFPDTYLGNSNVVNQLHKVLRNADIFETAKHRGFLKTVGVGGSLTGTAADFLLIDDPVKDSIEAMSPTYQVRNWNWFNDVAKTRLHNNSKVLITQTRWDVNDLSGLLLKGMSEGYGEKWVILTLPAIKEDNFNKEDPRQIGEALWESWHSKERLMAIQKQSLRTFQSLYQQNPKPTQVGGEFYKSFHIHKQVVDASLIKGFNIVNGHPYNEILPLHISFDENVHPYLPCTVHQLEGKTDIQVNEICMTHPRNTIKAICREIFEQYRHHIGKPVFIYGDQTAIKEDVKLEKGMNFFVLIQNELEGYGFKVTRRVQSKNPSLVMRGLFINAVFEAQYGGLDFLIHQDCVKTVEDYVSIKEDADGTKLKQTAKEMSTGVTYQRWGHLSDCNDYLQTMAYHSEYSEFQSGSKPHMFRGGRNVSKNSW